MRRRRPIGAAGRTDPMERRFRERLEDLRAEYRLLTAPPELTSRIRASLRRAPGPRRRRGSLSLATSLLLAFVGGFFAGRTPNAGPHTAAHLGVPAGHATVPSAAAAPAPAPRSPVTRRTDRSLLPPWAFGVLHDADDPDLARAGRALERALDHADATVPPAPSGTGP